MNKENYTRRPNEAFKKIKDYSKKEVRKKKWKNPNLKISLKNFNKKKFKHFYQTKIYYYIKVLSLIIILTLIAWVRFFEDIYHNYQKAQYEEKELIDYFYSSKKDLEELHGYFEPRKKTIIEVQMLYTWRSIYYVKVRSQEIDTSKNLYNLPKYANTVKDRIEENNLVFFYKNKPDTIRSNWTYSFSHKSINEFSPTFFSYMKTSPEKLMNVVRKLNENKWEVDQSDNFTVTFEHEKFYEYDFILTNKILKTDTINGEIRRIGEIEGGAYWRKIEELNIED